MRISNTVKMNFKACLFMLVNEMYDEEDEVFSMEIYRQLFHVKNTEKNVHY